MRVHTLVIKPSIQTECFSVSVRMSENEPLLETLPETLPETLYQQTNL